MALMAYLRLTGEQTGEIKGSIAQKGREGKIGVIAVSHTVVSPRDAASGQATGRNQHSPLVITKELDRASPLLHQAQAGNENFKEFVLEFWRPSSTGAEQQHYTMTLGNASIASLRMVMANVRDPSLMKLDIYEEVAFTYQRITWTWNDGGISAKDEWTG